MASNTHWTAGYARQVEKTLTHDAHPKLGDLPLADINPVQVLEAPRPVLDRNARAVARNLRQWIGAVFRYDITTLRCQTDPTAALGQLVKRTVVRHHPPLPIDAIPDFLRNYTGYGIAKPATLLMLYTFFRTAEIRNAEWSNINWEARLWRIPGHKMKMGSDHIAPLSRQALDLLGDLHGLTGQLPPAAGRHLRHYHQHCHREHRLQTPHLRTQLPLHRLHPAS
ncbi:tyrosine-type recombinase/integrase [Aquitalea sp. ASV15]|uniref:tyrosine-type recombinase/integrase n=1 Tax=Aquitalea sp. ASV15 TaxID=2795104 RepID=UPI0018EE2252|nr:tyrosine-type recombinase/integrase [Aquitalea sp. ASV15]